jgi:hypothetical protein
MAKPRLRKKVQFLLEPFTKQAEGTNLVNTPRSLLSLPIGRSIMCVTGTRKSILKTPRVLLRPNGVAKGETR